MYLFTPFIGQEQIFFGTNHYYYFHLPTGPFHCVKSKKILTADPELKRCAIFGHKMGLFGLISPNEIFFSENLLISLVSFIHAYLHAKNQSQIQIC